MKQILPLGVYYLLIPFLHACSNDPSAPSEVVPNKTTELKSIPTLDYTVLGSYPHDITSYTEGLVFHNNQLYESTGATDDLPQTRSLFGVVDLSTGKINVKTELDRQKYFGEGIAFLNGKIYQLTYKTKVGFIYDAATFKALGQFTFPSKEGWGLTTDSKYLIMSDGTNILTYIDPNNLQAVKKMDVSENNYTTSYLNELEYINGYIYANIYTTNTIVKIDVVNSQVIAKLDLTPLVKSAKGIYPGSLDMNGIAFDSTNNKIYVTGKMWPKIFQIDFDH
ncbi:MAG: glutaminyl-peptide cyclotransferase [Bacteroidetes bacterium]|nr:MAG: glutaminyl-peptide cyclotransferase [Bacteroidota bacterium]